MMPPRMPQQNKGLLAYLGIDGAPGHLMLQKLLGMGNGGTPDMGRQQQGGMGQAISGLMNPTNPGMPGIMAQPSNFMNRPNYNPAATEKFGQYWAERLAPSPKGPARPGHNPAMTARMMGMK